MIEGVSDIIVNEGVIYRSMTTSPVAIYGSQRQGSELMKHINTAWSDK